MTKVLPREVSELLAEWSGGEAYLRLAQGKHLHFQSRAHFFAVAANLMRQIMVDHARARRSAKRGGGLPKVSLDEALGELARADPRKVHPNTVLNDWREARAWLYCALGAGKAI